MLGAIIGGLGGLFGGIAKARAQQAENRRAAEEANRQRQLEMQREQQRMQFQIDTATRQAAKLEDVAGMFRTFGEQQDPYASQMQGMADIYGGFAGGTAPVFAQQQQLAEQMMMGDPFEAQQMRLARGMAGMGQGDSSASLEAEMERQLARSSRFAGGAMAGAGIAGSGAARASQAMMRSEMMGNLAQAITADRRAQEQMRMAGQQGAAGIYGQMGASRQMGRQAASNIYGQLAGLQMQGAQGAAGIYDQMNRGQMQRQQAMLSGLQGLYANPAFGMAGMDPSQYSLNPGDFMSPLPSMSWGNAILGGIGGAFQGVSSAYQADPTIFSHFGKPPPEGGER